MPITYAQNKYFLSVLLGDFLKKSIILIFMFHNSQTKIFLKPEKTVKKSSI